MTVNLPARRLLLIFNPAAGWRRRRRLDDVLRRLDAAGCTVTLRETARPGDAERFAAEARGMAFERLVVAGGDGTINEAINGLAGSMLPVAVVPLGTANVLAAEIGLKTDAESIARAIMQGLPRPVALGEANGRRFVLMAGAGFDAHVVRDVTAPLKRGLGKGAYVLAALRQMLAFGFFEYRVSIDGAERVAGSVIVANGRYYAGKYVCAPDGHLERPELAVCLFERSSRWSVAVYAMALLTGRLPGLASYRVISARHVAIAGRPGEPLQGDGDIIGRLDATIRMLPDALNLIFPPERDAIGDAAGARLNAASAD